MICTRLQTLTWTSKDASTPATSCIFKKGEDADAALFTV
jgi:hypothetical protein